MQPLDTHDTLQHLRVKLWVSIYLQLTEDSTFPEWSSWLYLAQRLVYDKLQYNTRTLFEPN